MGFKEWTDATVEEIKSPVSNALATGPFGSAISSRFFQETGIPVIRGSNLSTDIGTRLIDKGLAFVSEEKAEQFKRSTARKGDLIFTCWGTIDQVGLIDKRSKYEQYIVSNKQMKFTPDTKRADCLFLYYFFSSPKMKTTILNQGIGSSVPGFNLGQLRSMDIVLPPLPEQKAIAHILGTLDDKIELNRKMNDTLAAMARAIFKSWFVDFDPVRIKAEAKAEGRSPNYALKKLGLSPEIAALFPDEFEDSELGKIPKGWTAGSIADIASFVNGRNFTKNATGTGRMVIRIAELNSGPGGSTKYNDVESEEVNTAYPDDILFAWSGSLDVYRWHLDEALINQHIFKVVCESYSPWFVYQWLRECMPFFQDIASHKATTMGHIKRGHLNEARIPLAPNGLIESVGPCLTPLYELIHKHERQSQSLAQTRDALLPKLLSGQVLLNDKGFTPTEKSG